MTPSDLRLPSVWSYAGFIAFLQAEESGGLRLGSDLNSPRSSIPTSESLGPKEEISLPGHAPFTRGIHEGMYRTRLWTMRQYAGFGNALNTNKRFKMLLDDGQTGLSVAFDLPTQLGLDSDDERSGGEVGKVGVPIDSIHDMRVLFDGINLGSVSTSMTINASATSLLALYVAIADEQGVPRYNLRGTVQNDILKEYIARGLYVFPPDESLRLTADLMEWCSQNTPQWNTISISGYHIREAGSTAVQELAFTLANALEYSDAALTRGLSFDEIGPRISFFFGCHNDFFEEIAKFRASRKLWHDLVKERYNPSDDKSLKLRFHTQTSGVTLTAQQPNNNTVRVAYQALAAVLGGTQSLHTNAFDEAIGLPTEESARLALRTQQILAHETGIKEVVDPLAGSYLIEELTESLYSRTKSMLDDILAKGGALSGIITGDQQRAIHESAWTHLNEIESGNRQIIGVNSNVSDESGNDDVEPPQEDVSFNQIEQLQVMKKNRDCSQVEEALELLRMTVCNGQNVMESMISAYKSEATIGEVNQILREEFGEWRSPSGV